MEYQKIANLLDDNRSNQPSKFRTKNWAEINDESRGTYNVNSQIKFKTTMLKSSLCDYSDAYILVKGTITIAAAGDDAAARQADERDKGVVFKNCAPFTNCISEINNTQVDNAKDIDIVMPMYNLIECSDNYAKTSGSLWQYYRDEPDDNLANSESFKFKVKITGKTPAADNEKDVEIMVPLKYLSNFWRTLEMPLINSDVNLINKRKLQQLKSSFKRVINWNKYLSKPELLRQNPNLNYLIEPSFQGVNRLFILAFENDTQRTSHSGYYLPNVEIKNYNIVINGENVFDQPIKNKKITYDNIRKVATGYGNDYTTGCLLDYPYFIENYKMIAVDLSKQKALDFDPKAIQQIKFTAHLDRAGNTRVYFILEEAKETVLDFSQGIVKVL